MKRRIIGLMLLLAVGASLGLWYVRGSSEPERSFRTAEARRGNITAFIGATGTLEPEEVVDVGAQVAGIVSQFGRDPRDPNKAVDYGTRVEPGTVLARIDDAIYKAQVEQAQANLERAEADMQQFQAKVRQTQRDYERARTLSRSSGAISGLDFDTTEAAYDTAKSALAVGQAGVNQAKAAFRQVQTNLGYCTITSPVKGVIVDRRVNVGQTVVSSLNAPSLFLIAKDLSRMQIWASVNEADIGQIQSGQDVRFTVDAHPDEVFLGKVEQIRLNATMTQNVVTYTVVVSTDNKDGRLLPYLTANVQFLVGQRQDVLLVPNTALRWKPLPAQIVAEARGKFGRDQQGPAGGSADATAHRGVVWIEEGNLARPIPVQIGMTDGTMTEVTAGDLPAGARVILGLVEQRQQVENSASPFTPQLFGKKSS